jgi:hypothetical protein
MSVFYPVWQAHSPDLPKDSKVSKAYALLAVRWFHTPFNFRTKINPARCCIDFRDLTRDPVHAIEKLYAHFGWTPSEAFLKRLTAAVQQEKEFRSKHEYTLEEYGLSKEWIQQELGAVLDFYALPR